MYTVIRDNAVFTVPDTISTERVAIRVEKLYNYYLFLKKNPNFNQLIELEVKQLVKELQLLGVRVTENFETPLDERIAPVRHFHFP